MRPGRWLLLGLLAASGCTPEAADPPHPPGPRFVELAAQVGLDFLHVNGASGRYYYVETYGSGLAFLDYDGDGFQDLYLVNSAALPGFAPPSPPTNQLYRNDQRGGFARVEAGVAHPGYGLGTCAGDYDNDGHIDLYLTNFGPNVLYRNRGDGTFADITARAGVGDPRLSTSAAFADIDNDGDLDLYAANNAHVDLDQHQPCRQDTTPVYCAPTEYPGVSGVLYRNDGAHRFSDITRQAGLYDESGRQLGVVFGDVDDDGDVDLYVANDMTANFLFRNEGGGRFVEVGLIAGVALNEGARPEAGMGTDMGDWDRDGDLDIAVCNFQWESCRLYQNEGEGLFTDFTSRSGLGPPTLATLTFGTFFFDSDNDGYLDLFLANGHVHPQVQVFDRAAAYPQRDQLFRNDGVGTFSEIGRQAGLDMAFVGRGAARADYDNDGDLDVAVGNNGQRALLLRNEGTPGNHWLGVRTVGTTSNRDGIGARVRVRAGDLVQIDQVRSGASYLSQSDLRLHFGLGPRNQVDEIEIRWPSGRLQTLTGVAADQLLVVREPAAN